MWDLGVRRAWPVALLISVIFLAGFFWQRGEPERIAIGAGHHLVKSRWSELYRLGSEEEKTAAGWTEARWVKMMTALERSLKFEMSEAKVRLTPTTFSHTRHVLVDLPSSAPLIQDGPPAAGRLMVIEAARSPSGWVVPLFGVPLQIVQRTGTPQIRRCAILAAAMREAGVERIVDLGHRWVMTPESLEAVSERRKPWTTMWGPYRPNGS